MAFGGPTASRGWFSPEGIAAWQRAAAFWDEMADRADSMAIEVAETHVLEPIRRAILDDPSINSDNSDWSMGAEVADALQVYPSEDGIRIGVPDDHPAAEKARDMEYGSETQPPSPHFRDGFSPAALDRARAQYERRLQQRD